MTRYTVSWITLIFSFYGIFWVTVTFSAKVVPCPPQLADRGHCRAEGDAGGPDRRPCQVEEGAPRSFSTAISGEDLK